VEVEFRVRPPGGDVKWLCVKGGYQGDGEGPRLSGAVIDVTRSRLREQELKHQAAIFHSFQDAVVLLDLAGRIFDWNPSAVQSFGASREQAVGQSLFALIKPGSAIDAVMLRALERSGRWTTEEVFVGAGGSTRFGEFSAVPLQSSSGPPLGYVVI